MKFRCIFTHNQNGKLWAVACKSSNSKKGSDEFVELLNRLNDTEYLFQFFTSNNADLDDPFWNGLSVDEAIDKVLDEAYAIEKELYSIVNRLPGYEYCSLNDVFLPLHQNIYSLNFKNERYRKAKPDFDKPMIRIYAVELEDGTLIITGGAIKLTRDMPEEEFKEVFGNLNKVRDFLREEKIIDLDGLKELTNE